MQHPKCVEKLVAHCLTKNVAENLGLTMHGRGSSAGRTKNGLISEQKDSHSSTFTGGMPERKTLDFYDQEEDACNTVTKTTMK